MKNVCGPAVRGEDFRFRDDVVAEILSQLDAGNSVLLIGLRRIGKTSVMFGVEDRAPTTWTVSRHNVQDMRLPSDFFGLLLKSLPKGALESVISNWRKAKTIPSRVISTIQTRLRKLGGGGVSVEFDTSVVDYWEPLTQGIELALANAQYPIVIILDEFPLFIEHLLKSNTSSVQVEAMLGQLKAWREQYSNFRLLIGGSISLDRVLTKHQISASTVGDLSRYFLPPLEHTQAKALLQELAHSHKLAWFNDDLIEESLTLIEDYYPFFLQAFFLQVRQRGKPDAPDLALIFENHFIPYVRKGFFEQYLERLRNHYLKAEQETTRNIFDLISSREDHRAHYAEISDSVEALQQTNAVDLDELLYDLTGDDFLRLDSRTNEYSFATKLTARWWQLTRGRK